MGQAPIALRHSPSYWLIVWKTLESGRVLLLDENLSCALTMSSYFGIVVTANLGTTPTTL